MGKTIDVSKLGSAFRKERAARDRALYEEFEALVSEHGVSVTAVTRALMRKYGLHSPTTVWNIRRRMEAARP